MVSAESGNIAELEKLELSRTDCFLCKPLLDLHIHQSKHSFVMAGLGPIVDGYSIVATNLHIDRTISASKEQLQAFAEHVESVRQELTCEYGSCLITEHGNMPVCGLDECAHIHCFHPHFLLFPSSPSIQSECVQYFGNGGNFFSTMFDALSYGKTLGHYLLVSEVSGEYWVFQPKGDLPKQFGRALVAETNGVPDLASWRNFPNLNAALENAEKLRKLFK